MSTTLRTTATLKAPSTAAAVAFAAVATLESTTAIVTTTGVLADAVDFIKSADTNADASRIVALAQPSEIASVISATKNTGPINVIVPSVALLGLIPTLRDLSRQRTPVTIHVPVGSAAQLSEVLAVRDSGCALIRSSSPQSAVDFAVASALASRKLGLPVIHCFQQALSQEAVDVLAYEPASGQTQISDFLQATTASQDEETNDVDKPSESATEVAHKTFAQALALFGAQNSTISYTGAADATLAYVTFGSSLDAAVSGGSDKAGAVQVSLLRPFSADALIAALPKTATHVVALEQVTRQPTPWGPLLFDLAAMLNSAEWAAQTDRPRPVLLNAVTTAPLALFSADKLSLVTGHAKTFDSPAHFDPAAVAGISAAEEADDVDTTSAAAALTELSLEEQQKRVEKIPYGQLLRDIFKQRLNVVNAAEATTIWGDSAKTETNPEFGFGQLASFEKERARLVDAVTAVLRTVSVPLSKELHAELSTWLSGRDDPAVATREAGERIAGLLEAEKGEAKLGAIHRQREYFASRSNWLVGADEWAYDIGSSGVHHVIASGLNVNMLVLDTAQYPFSAENKGAQRKKDIGLYAMNYGTTYVASVAVYSSYTQVLQALVEADAFPGPSVVVAYLPHSDGVFSSNYSPIDVLKQSKLAVDTGAWPLYRWNPKLDDPNRRFQLDSERLLRSVQAFLDRDNVLAAIGNPKPEFSGELGASVEKKTGDRLARKARGDVDNLLGGLSGPPLLVLFASDNGNAEDVARRVARQGRRRGMDVRCISMDEFEVDELPFEKTVVVSVSTAGQGEIPTNGREFLKSLQAASINLNETDFAVMGLGDSHYWPREEDAIFYNKPARDIDRKLAELGGKRITAMGLGDDQDADGWETGYADFEARLWAALNIAVVGAGGEEEEEHKRTDEENKVISNYLRGTIAQAVGDVSCGYVDEWDGKLLKFHGTYMQDDRDLRPERLARGEEKAYSFMIRVRLPGGIATPAQWLAMDRLADEFGNHTMKITTRQTFQLHGVLKRNLRDTMRGINRALMDTIAACGDVNRNVVASANPLQAHLQPEIAKLAADISAHLLPSTSAYHEIWLDDKMVAGSAEQTSPVQDHEPLYGQAYLPRKFKIAIAIPPENDVDVVAYDLGYIAILDAAQQSILGYNVMIGGGMGMTHNNKKTYPRLASCLGYVPKDRAIVVAEKVMLVQRDHGDRSNRKHARMKYTVDDHGMEWWRQQVEDRLGFALEDPRPYAFARNGDRYGWVKSTPGYNNFTMFIQNGRVADLPGNPLKAALVEVANAHKGTFRLTCNAHLIVADVKDEDVPAMSALLAKHRLDNLDYSALRLHSMACAALPTCGLAMAESERYLPRLIDLLDTILDEAGLRHDAIVIRMTGCPNGCARPYNAEIAFVGKAPGAYNLYLGGSHSGERLNKIFRETLTEEQILEVLAPIIKQYALERNDAEHFGDFVIRKGIIKETREGKDFHDL
ncbi:Sulfite reductase [NADPH] subunit beta [Coemansia sp. RSA 1813]|nr:Sulfite reductase [NADPH] subunit beta [Coemansia sp. RSA 1646]KAJ1774057.1 Sulfite reductase [NADPH] subunit beta [Coemansia sp. RSA 1843]KAJ2092552.1 Sulfite reductase [NADPH] subunit beta [Coemansia sp. RSA 986]KAJ2216753.1 Sulfite reductase [NADPH] subunit beta [Coemansia sp. RSA 487]KAJ2572825.1 Sulfite reductase [NADPH] subunit beta [Coemansia sp. RSA 1813]